MRTIVVAILTLLAAAPWPAASTACRSPRQPATAVRSTTGRSTTPSRTAAWPPPRLHGRRLSYTPGSIPLPLRRQGVPFPAGVTENTSLPIVLLVHGNSDTPPSSSASRRTPAPRCSSSSSRGRARTYAVDMRIDKNDDPKGNLQTENAANNIDHGWATPIVQHFIEATLAAFPDRRRVGHRFSLGVTVVRDALRACTWLTWRAAPTPGSASTASSSWRRQPRCLDVPHPVRLESDHAGRVACEMGDRLAFTPTDFMQPLNARTAPTRPPAPTGRTLRPGRRLRRQHRQVHDHRDAGPPDGRSRTSSSRRPARS